MKKFTFGLITGIILAAVLGFFFHPSPELRIELGRLLDRDTIYLKNGKVVEGWVVKEDNNQIWVELGTGHFILHRAECKAIRKNSLLRYVRELM
jgi:hypothetical protein